MRTSGLSHLLHGAGDAIWVVFLLLELLAFSCRCRRLKRRGECEKCPKGCDAMLGNGRSRSSLVEGVVLRSLWSKIAGFRLGSELSNPGDCKDVCDRDYNLTMDPSERNTGSRHSGTNT